MLALLPECIITYDLLMLMDVLAILFFTNTDIDMKNRDRLFLKVWVKRYSERHWRRPGQK